MAKIIEKYQSKSITPVDEYVCTLSPELQKLAEKNFGETPEIRDKSLRELREWIWNNPRIEKCRMDSRFLLRFLRMSKYSLRLAKEVLERWLVFREGLYGEDWFTNLDTQRPGVRKFLNDGMFIVLPNYSVTGEKILLVRVKACDTSVKNAGNEMFCLMTMVMESLFDDEENQVKGYTMFLDLAGIRLSHYLMYSFKMWFRIMKHVERTFTGQHVGCHILHLNPALAFVVKILMKHMKEKMRNCVTFPSDINSLNFVDKKNLPRELGGEWALDDLIELQRNKLDSWREMLLDYSKMKINQKYYTDAVLKCDPGTLAHTYENRSAKLLKIYPDENENEADE